MNEKILQIIPAPADMWATYEDEQTGKISRDRVACLALIGSEDGFRDIYPMVQIDPGCFDPVTDVSNFVGIEYGEA